MPEDLAHQQVARPDRRQDDLDDAALLLLDDAGQDREAEAEDPDEDEHRADVGEEERAPSASVCGSSDSTAGASGRPRARPGRRRPRSARPASAARRPPPMTIWAIDLVRLLVEADRARAGQVGRDDHDRVDLALVEGRLGGRCVGVGHELDRPVELVGASR